MTLRPQSLPPVPEATVAAVQAAFPKGNPYVELRAEFGTLHDDQLFADLYLPEGRPVKVAPWRLALVVVRQYIEGLTDSQAAHAVRRCIDWKYALSLELTDPGFDFTLLHDFRSRLLTHEAGPRFLDAFLAACKARGWIKAHGTQRTDSTHVVAAIRTLHRLECVLEAMRYALNQLSAADPAWVQHVPPDWYPRYGLRSDQARLPKDASKRETRARQIGADGFQLLAWVQTADPPLGLGALPALEALRQIWLQQYCRCTVPGLEALCWHTGDEQPSTARRIASPYDLEARYSSKRNTHWVGYKMHLAETCDAGRPALITQIITTPATTQDSVMVPTIHRDLAQRELLPRTHLLTAAMSMRTFWGRPRPSIRPMCLVRRLGPTAGNGGPGRAMTCRPLCWIGRPSRRTVPKGSPASTGGLDVMCRAIRSSASVLTGPPVARAPLARRVPRRAQPRASSPFGRKPTTRPSRLRANGRRPPCSKPSRPCKQVWRVASRKASGALISVRVGTLGWHERTSSSC